MQITPLLTPNQACLKQVISPKDVLRTRVKYSAMFALAIFADMSVHHILLLTDVNVLFTCEYLSLDFLLQTYVNEFLIH